ncbi:MAG: DUF1538 domain-containing protein [Mariprofundaceae bacterium]
MMIDLFISTFIATLRDLVPIVVILFGFQFLVLRQPIIHARRVFVGMICVLFGLTLFLVGLKEALFPLGEIMARQLTDPAFLAAQADHVITVTAWQDYGWVYLFAFTIGFSTTLAEPALMAVANKAEQVSANTVSALGLRLTVALGVATGVTIGCFRIVTGTDLWLYIVVAYVIVLIQTLSAPKMIIPLAYDSGGVTTSTVTVPLLAALGLGLAQTIPGRSPLIDGFGLIAFASVFPIMSVLAYAQLSEWIESKRYKRR